jgi:type IV pilus assembly protein PilQ
VLIFIASALIAGCVGVRSLKQEKKAVDSAKEANQTDGDKRSATASGIEPVASLPQISSIGDSASPFFDEGVGAVSSEREIPTKSIQKVIEGIELVKSGGDSNQVVAKVAGDVTWSVKKTAPSEFSINFQGVTLAESNISPIMSESPEAPIRSVRTVKEGDDVVLRIFVNPTIALKVEKTSPTRLEINPTSDAVALLENSVADQANSSGLHAVDLGSDIRAAVEGAINDSSDVRAQLSQSGDSKKVGDSLDVTGEIPKYTGRLISLDLQDTGIDNALRIIAEVSNLNIIASGDVNGKITLRLIDVPWDQALDVILKTNGLDKVQEGNVVRIAPVEKLRAERESLKQAKQAEEELEPLKVKFVRVSYAKAADLKPLIDSVISERGSATFDERTNQMIVKDISRGIKNVVQLVQKIDLRTPQILLETQIVEAQRRLLRDLGSELGFQYVQSPATGNGTGRNFPNSIGLGAVLNNAQPQNSNPISLLFGSADGSKSLTARLTSLETEGRVKIVSRPSVATTNNKQAIIKSVQKVRVRLPQGGVSVATGQGATAAGQGQMATEIIEIGILLEVTPQASPDYYVLLDINAKSSTFGAEETDGIPNEVERSATSSVLVSSGQTFALGGIYKLTDRDNLNGVPFFKDIPVFGHFFGLQAIEQEDEELLFFITPRIVEGSFDDSTMKAVS